MQVDLTINGQFATYRVTSPLGAGGRGSTFLAVVESIQPSALTASLVRTMPVAIKVPPTLSDDYPASAQRAFLNRVNEALRAEYRLFDRLKGVPSAAQVYDLGPTIVQVGGDPEACFALVSEYIQGPTLAAWRYKNTEALEEATFFFRWARLLARAVGHIHRAGVVHGDIYPDNIIIRNDSEPVLIDFGASVIRTAMLEERRLAYTHPYCAPERARSVEADLYSLGGTLYYLATGEAPPQPDHAGKVRAQVVHGLKKANSRLYTACSGIANVIARCLRPVTDVALARTANAEQLLEDLDLFDPAAAEAAKNIPNVVHSVGGMIAKLEVEEPLFARLVASRLRQLEHDIDEMLHQVHDVQGDHEHLVIVLSQFLSVCEEGDLYVTVSVPWLWYGGNIGVRGRFLAVNKAAAKRGTTLRRVFVVTPDDLHDDATLDVLRAHAELLSEIEDEQPDIDEFSSSMPQQTVINTTDPQIDSAGVFTGVLLVDDDDERRHLFEKLPHCGIWIRGSRSKVVIPRYDEQRRLTGIRLIPGDGSPQAQIRLFEREFLTERVEEIRAFLSRWLDRSGVMPST